MIMASRIEAAPTTHYGPTKVRLRCPRCGGWIGHLPDTNAVDATLVCSDCYLKLTNEHGIWRSLLPERFAHFSSFMKKDQCDPSIESCGSVSPEYYLALPYRDRSGHDNQQSVLRSSTFRYIKQHILPGIVPKHNGQLKILDLGAGNCWLSYRLALEGHAPIAVDLLTNDRDGLGAACHYKKHLTTLFPRFQAELDTLPFVDDDFDLVIYNASFHYSENYERTLAEALRCTRSDGTVLIAGTPWYKDGTDCQQILVEHRETYLQRDSLQSDTPNSLEYLTDKRLQRMEASFGIHWQIHTPNYGIQQLMREVLAKLRGSYESSRLRIYTAKARK
jgi:SAM-dependent methyltransferase